ncbi:MAG: hypothetical protein P4L28_11700 [Paludibacteraceae bacterium]|nr:hypothetical protein [Paludibacteraceae bacterium]
MKQIIGILLLFFMVEGAFAASQVPDICMIRKDTVQDTLAFFVYPLEDYFEQQGERNLGGFKSCESNACQRGYQAVWKVEHDSLFLVNIQGCNEHMSWCDETTLPNLRRIFGDQCVGNKVFAKWVFGKYRAFEGNEVPYLKKQLFNAERELKIIGGKVKWIHRYVNVMPRNKSFAVEPNTPDFMVYFIKSNLNWKAIPKRDPNKWIADMDIYIKKNGKAYVKIKTTGTTSFVTATEKEFNRVLQKTKWFKYREKGKRIEVCFNVRAEFDADKQIISVIK